MKVKKSRWLVILMVVAMLFSLVPAVAGANNDCEPCEPELIVDLIAGQNMVVGTVTVTNDADQICVTYALDEEALEAGWLLYETHLYIGDCDFDGVLTPYNQRAGGPHYANPIPGQFPYGDDELDGVEEWTFCISFDDLGFGICEEVCIAAHAVVKRIVQEAYCETVVEAGSDFFVSDTDTKVVAGNVDGAEYPENAVLAHKPGDPGSPYGPVWDTNLTRAFDADAEWIWESYYVVNPILGDVVTFEKEFEVPGPPSGGTLYIATDNGFAAYLNDEPLGSFNLFQYPDLGDLKQPYVNTTNWWQVQSYDLAADLEQGTNTLKVIGVNEYMNPDDVDAAGNAQRIGDKYWNPGGVIFEFGVCWDEVVECYPDVWEDETAWGEGDRFNERGNWGMFFKYKICPPEECIPASIIYGVVGDGSVGSLWKIDLSGDSIVETKLIDIDPVGGSTQFYPNGLAYDDENERLYYAVRSSAGTQLFMYDFENAPVLAATGLSGDIYGATWGAGKYWYIRNGSNDMRTVTFDVDGVNGVVEMFEANFAGGKSFNFGDIALDAEENVIYVSTSFSGTNREFFKYDLGEDEGARYSPIIDSDFTGTAVGLQLGFGEDGVLYGHSTFAEGQTGAAAREFFAVDKAGTVTSLGIGVNAYNDLASGPSICD